MRVCKEDDESLWGLAKFDLWPPVNPSTLVTKFCTGDYFSDTYHPAKFYPDRTRGFVSEHVQLRAPNCLPGYFWGVLTITYSHDATMDIDAKYVKRHRSAEGCAFSGSQNQNLTFTPHFLQKPPF